MRLKPLSLSMGITDTPKEYSHKGNLIAIYIGTHSQGKFAYVMMDKNPKYPVDSIIYIGPKLPEVDLVEVEDQVPHSEGLIKTALSLTSDYIGGFDQHIKSLKEVYPDVTFEVVLDKVNPFSVSVMRELLLGGN